MEQIRCKIEWREDDDRRGPGRLSGVLMRYGEKAGDRAERFAPGSLVIPSGGVMLREQHDRMQPIVRFTPEDNGAEVRVDVDLPDTQRGRDAATMVRNGSFTGLSVEFQPASVRTVGGIREIRKALLTGAGLVDDASYKGASVEMRHAGGPLPRLWL